MQFMETAHFQSYWNDGNKEEPTKQETRWIHRRARRPTPPLRSGAYFSTDVTAFRTSDSVALKFISTLSTKQNNALYVFSTYMHSTQCNYLVGRPSASKKHAWHLDVKSGLTGQT